MRRLFVSIVCAAGVVAISGAAWAGQPGSLIPFQAGQKARAAQVNQNFNTLETAITDNHNRLTSAESSLVQLQTDVNLALTGSSSSGSAFGQLQSDVAANAGAVSTNAAAITSLQTDVAATNALIGTVQSDVAANVNDIGTALAKANANSAAIAGLGGTVPSGLSLPLQVLLDGVGIGAPIGGGWAVSATGYLFKAINPNIQAGDFSTVQLANGNVGYASTDCTGSPYMTGGNVPPYAGGNGFVVRGTNLTGTDTGQLFSVAPMTVPVTLRLESFGTPGNTCQANPSAGLSTGWPLTPNNPAVTGVDGAMTGTLTLGWPQ